MVSDPWDFGTEHGCGPFLAQIIKFGPNPWDPKTRSVFIRLLKPLKYKGETCEYFVASPKLADKRLEDLNDGDKFYCGLTHIPPQHASATNPFDLSWWRGGIALEGTLTGIKGDITV